MSYTLIEDYVRDLYHRLSITEPHQLRIENISEKLDLEVFYSNATFRFYNSIILERTNRQKEWQEFGHEVCHYLRHHGNQLTMNNLFLGLQEHQADYFAYHFCVPTFMLDRLKELTVYDVMSLFNVEYEFALKRIDMYQSKLIMKYA